jgi:hypothetical protein
MLSDSWPGFRRWRPNWCEYSCFPASLFDRSVRFGRQPERCLGADLAIRLQFHGETGSMPGQELAVAALWLMSDRVEGLG